MKICAVVAEYNPFHLGHLKQIEYMKSTLKAEKIIVVMSGNFTQRGEPAVMNKFKRARQAIIAGADMVIELPTVFATANAEIFAKGAVKIIDSLNVADGLCFGVENGEKQDYINLANYMNNESKEFKRILKNYMDTGVSLAKAKFMTIKELYNSNFDENLVSLPNNILGLEYTRALLDYKSDIEIFPLVREGDHNDLTLRKGITSASSIRQAIKLGKIKKIKRSMPSFVYKDVTEYPFAFDKLIVASVICNSAENMSKILDCTEGLENRIKALVKDNKTIDELVEKVSTKRYTKSRIRRILLSNFLGIESEFISDCLKNGLYAKILAVDSNGKDLISLLSEKSSIPVITRKSDVSELKKTSLKSFELDTKANSLYNLVTNDNQNENNMIMV